MAAENRDFGRFVTNWYNVHCKHTRFLEFLGLLNEGFGKKLGLWWVRVGFGGREGALASALIIPVNYLVSFSHGITILDFYLVAMKHIISSLLYREQHDWWQHFYYSNNSVIFERNHI